MQFAVIDALFIETANETAIETAFISTAHLEFIQGQQSFFI